MKKNSLNNTVNSELQNKIESLSETNDDMQNLLNSTDIATIFLDCNLKIKRFTRQAKNIIKLIDSDIGDRLKIWFQPLNMII
jgi:two-component system, chemotaxis family, CheB/CheR fusion protein